MGGPERHLYVVEWNQGNVQVTLMTNFKKEPSYSGMYPKVIGNGNPEEIGYAGFVFGGILIVAVFVKAIQKFGRTMQSSGEKTKNLKIDQFKDKKFPKNQKKKLKQKF